MSKTNRINKVRKTIGPVEILGKDIATLVEEFASIVEEHPQYTTILVEEERDIFNDNVKYKLIGEREETVRETMRREYSEEKHLEYRRALYEELRREFGNED